MNIEHPAELIAYLRAQGHIAPDETPRITLLAGGVSNRTVLVERANGDAWVLKQALAKLRVPVDWFSSPERIHREAEGLRWLTQLAPSGALPAFVFEDHAAHLLAMTAVPQPHTNWKTRLLAGELVANHVTQFATLLATIHRQASNQAAVAAAFDDTAFFESLRLEPYYGYTAAQVPTARQFLENLIADTRATRLTLVHGDYSPKNILIHEDRLVLLDHEVIHWGDPAFDLGFSLTHLLSKAHHLPDLRAAFAEAAVHYWQVYQSANAKLAPSELEKRAVRHTLGCLLARVAGRSPLEYLSESEHENQQQVVTDLMTDPPATIPDLIPAFLERL
jgi:5-methylthioribose kinase